MQLQEFLILYRASTPPIFVFLQVVLAGLATAALVSGIFERMFVKSCGSLFERLQSLCGLISTLSPLLGFMLTLMGAALVPRMLSKGDLSGASEAISLALMSSLAGVSTAIIAICASYFSARCQAEESF